MLTRGTMDLDDSQAKNRVNTRRRLFKSVVSFFAILLVWIIIAPVLASWLIVEKNLVHADAIVVLGGSTAYVERTHKAAYLYKNGVSPQIFLTNDGVQAGWSQKEQRLLTYVELAKRELIAQGVSEAAIEILTTRVPGTIDEAKLLSKISTDRRWESLMIVTSANHTRRALWTFERVFTGDGAKVNIGIAPALAGPQSPQAFDWWLSRNGWKDVAGEYVKSIYYYCNY